MADIRLAIKIPEEIRLALINNIQLSLDQQSICDSYIKQAIINGTPLPKGCGRLIDADNTISKICSSTCGCHSKGCGYNKPCYSVRMIESASTIIEAAEGEEDEKESLGRNS